MNAALAMLAEVERVLDASIRHLDEVAADAVLSSRGAPTRREAERLAQIAGTVRTEVMLLAGARAHLAGARMELARGARQ